jgi:hypothetical protein
LLQGRDIGLAVKVGDVVEVVACPAMHQSTVLLTPSLATEVIMGLQDRRADRSA